jgi:hypothetical protein
VAPDTAPLLVGPTTPEVPTAAAGVAAGATGDEGVIAAVVTALPTPAPNPTTIASTVAPPNRAIVFLTSVFVGRSNLDRVVIPPAVADPLDTIPP